VDEVIEQKFHSAAALKAEHDLHDWALTETSWTNSRPPRWGAFEFIRLPTCRSRSSRSVFLRIRTISARRDRLYCIGDGRHFNSADGSAACVF
jgi:hypothetical protein